MAARSSTELRAIPLVERATHAVGLHLADRTQLEVTQGEAHVLAFLYGRGAARVGEIHEEFGHRRSTLTSILGRLEGRGLLGRAIDPDDRRGVLVTLTPRGKSLAKRVFEALKGFESAALAGFTGEEIRTFRAVASALGRHDHRVTALA
jgi:DNA-binding MarR family transcriptional regulator